LAIYVSLMAHYQMLRLHNLRSLFNYKVVVNELRASNEVAEARCRVYASSSSSSSSCSLRVRRFSGSLMLKVELVPPSLFRPSHVPSGPYFSACLGILFVSILFTCCSHFFWYCFISFSMFCAPVFSP